MAMNRTFYYLTESMVGREYVYFQQLQYGRYSDRRYGETSNFMSYFINFVETGNLNLVKMLIDRFNVDPAYSKNYPIRKACRHGHIEIVKYLASLPQVDPADDCGRAFTGACFNGHYDIVKFLAKHPSYNSSTPYPQYGRGIRSAISYASSQGSMEMVVFIVDLYPDMWEFEPVHNACVNGYLEIVKYLVSMNPHAHYNQAYYIAKRHKHKDIADFLMGVIQKMNLRSIK
jgi:ankyrin repeat protein